VNVTDIRQALGANLAVTYAPLGFQVKPFALSAPVPPGFQMLFDRVDFHQELQSGELLRFILLGTVGYADDVDAQEKTDALLNDQANVSDPLSVRQAVESDQALTSRLLDDGSILTGQPSVGVGALQDRLRGVTVPVRRPHLAETACHQHVPSSSERPLGRYVQE